MCPTQKSCAAIVVPYANHYALEEHLKEISLHVPEGRHAVVVMDRAGWHTKLDMKIPSNISLLFLPPYSPELNPQEKVWQFLRDTYLANCVFLSHDDIIDRCCKAWNAFASSHSLISSLSSRAWASLS